MNEPEHEQNQVDHRVKGAIEGLNDAIDRVNYLEDEKELLATAASRAANVVTSEMDVLSQEHQQLEQRIGPFIAANEAAKKALAEAEAAEQAYATALGEVEMAREAICIMQNDTRTRLPSRDRGVRETHAALQAKQSAVVKHAAAAKGVARKARAVAEKAMRNISTAAEVLGQSISVEEALQLDLEYQQQRRGLQQVLMHCDERLDELERSKQDAVELVSEAMEQLESLSNELHVASASASDAGAADASAADEECVTEPAPTDRFSPPRLWRIF